MVCVMQSRKGEKVERLLNQMGENPVWLARQLQVGKQSVYNWLSGDTKPRDSAIWVRIADILKVRPEVILDDAQELPAPLVVREVSGPKYPVTFPTAEIPLGNAVPAGNWAEPNESEDFIEVDAKFSGPKRFAAYIAGDSCFPFLHQGDLTIWESDDNPATGLCVLARRDGDHAVTVKQLLYEGFEFVLRAINPKHNDAQADGWKAIARLVGIIRNVNGTEHSQYNPKGIRP